MQSGTTGISLLLSLHSENHPSGAKTKTVAFASRDI